VRADARPACSDTAILTYSNVTQHLGAGSDDDIIADGSQRDPIGGLITPEGQHTAQVIGVIGNIKEDALNDDWFPQVYTVYLQDPSPAMTVLTRGNLSADPSEVLRESRITPRNARPSCCRCWPRRKLTDEQ